MKSLMDFCKNCGLIMILEERIGPHIKKIGKIGLTKVFPYNTDNPDEAEAYLVDEFTLEDADEVFCPKCEAGLLYEDADIALNDTCSICKKAKPGQFFQGGGGVCYDCEETPEGSALLEQLLKKWEYETSDGYLAKKADEELQKLDAHEPYYQEKRKSLLVQLLYYNIKSINKKYGL